MHRNDSNRRQELLILLKLRHSFILLRLLSPKTCFCCQVPIRRHYCRSRRRDMALSQPFPPYLCKLYVWRRENVKSVKTLLLPQAAELTPKQWKEWKAGTSFVYREHHLKKKNRIILKEKPRSGRSLGPHHTQNTPARRPKSRVPSKSSDDFSSETSNSSKAPSTWVIWCFLGFYSGLSFPKEVLPVLKSVGFFFFNAFIQKEGYLKT